MSTGDETKKALQENSDAFASYFSELFKEPNPYLNPNTARNFNPKICLKCPHRIDKELIVGESKLKDATVHCCNLVKVEKGDVLFVKCGSNSKAYNDLFKIPPNCAFKTEQLMSKNI